jgi:hypothetical protein
MDVSDEVDGPRPWQEDTRIVAETPCELVEAVVVPQPGQITRRHLGGDRLDQLEVRNPHPLTVPSRYRSVTETLRTASMTRR